MYIAFNSLVDILILHNITIVWNFTNLIILSHETLEFYFSTLQKYLLDITLLR